MFRSQNLSSGGAAQNQAPMCGAQQNTTGRRHSIQQTFVTPGPVIKKTDKNKIHFLRQRKVADLHAEMKELYARLDVLPRHIQIECTLTTETPGAQALARMWETAVTKSIDSYLESLKCERVVIGDKSIWSQVEVSVDKEQFESSALVLLKLPHKGAYNVIGKRDIVDEVCAKIREFARNPRDSNVQMQRAAQWIESITTVKSYEVLLLMQSDFKKEVEKTFRGLTVTVTRKTKEVTFRGRQTDVEAAKTRMDERLRKVQMDMIQISQGQSSLLSNPETRKMILQKFNADSVVAVWQDVLGGSQLELGVYAFSDVDAKRASNVIQKYVVQREFQIPSDDSAKLEELYSFMQKLKADSKGKMDYTIQQASRKIIVTATMDIVDKVTTQVWDFLQETRRKSKSFPVPQERLKFLREYYMEEVRAVEKSIGQLSVKISLHPTGAYVEGTAEGIDAAFTKLTGILDTIVYGEHTVTDKFEIQFLNTSQCKAELLSLEKSHNCVLSLEPETTGGKLSTGAAAGSDGALSSGTSGSGSETASSIVSVSIIQGSIAEQNVDVLVNSVPGNLDLRSGAVSASILRAGGQGLQDELKARRPGGMERGQAVYTSGNQLHCQWVCHMRLPAYEPASEQELDDMITSCLTECNKVGFTSIAFPALGTGGLGYHPDVVARTILGAVSKFERDVPNISLRDVRVVIYPKDQKSYAIFQQVKRESEVEANARASGPGLSEAQRPSTPGQGLKTTLYIYARSQGDVEGVTAEFNRVAQNHIQVQRLEEKPLHRITQAEKDKIGRICAECDVEQSHSSDYIYIRGLKDAVLKAMTLIKDMFLKKERKQHQEMLRNIVQWCYLKPQTTDMTEHSPADNSSIEQAFRAKNTTTEIAMRMGSGQQQVVVIDFNSMEQYPKTNPADTSCVIRRDKIKELAVQFRPPKNWTPTQELRVKLATYSPEYKEAERQFTASLRKTVTIHTIERVQNERLWKQYTAQRDHMAKQNPGHMNEMTLWHGTHPSAMDRIIQHGFNRSYCGLNATSYGKGVYFALDSAYSAQDMYSKPDAFGFKNMFQCKVLVGYSVKGDRNTMFLPDRLKDIPYDSATDDVNSPHMFVIFSDTQAYPEYLITFLM